MSATFKFKYRPHNKLTYRLGPENKIHYWDGTSWQPSEILTQNWCNSGYFEQQEVPDPSVTPEPKLEASPPSNYHPDAYEYKRYHFRDGSYCIFRRVPNGELDFWFGGSWVGQDPHLTDAEWGAPNLTPCENPDAKPKYEYKHASSGLVANPITYRRRIGGSDTDYWEPTKRTWTAIPPYADWNSSRFTPTTDPETSRLPRVNPAFVTEFTAVPSARSTLRDIDYSALEFRVFADSFKKSPGQMHFRADTTGTLRLELDMTYEYKRGRTGQRVYRRDAAMAQAGNPKEPRFTEYVDGDGKWWPTEYSTDAWNNPVFFWQNQLPNPETPVVTTKFLLSIEIPDANPAPKLIPFWAVPLDHAVEFTTIDVKNKMTGIKLSTIMVLTENRCSIELGDAHPVTDLGPATLSTRDGKAEIRNVVEPVVTFTDASAQDVGTVFRPNNLTSAVYVRLEHGAIRYDEDTKNIQVVPLVQLKGMPGTILGKATIKTA